MAYIYGVDIGGSKTKIGRFTDGGELLYKWEYRTNTYGYGRYVASDIAAALKGDMQTNGISPDEVIGIGCGVPGPVDGTGLITCINLGWREYPFASTLSKLTGFKVNCANDANAAAFGEMHDGCGKGFKNLLMVTLGTGVGGGIVIDGKIYNGSHGAAGEIGHIPVNPDETRPCRCGRCGCLEQYASAKGNARVALDYLNEVDTPSPLRNAERVNSKLCWDLAIEGDPVAVEIANRFSRYLGIGLAIAANTFDPEIIVLGGGVTRTGDTLIRYVEKYYRQYAFHACANTEIRIASLGNDAGIYGCMHMFTY